MYLTPEQQRIAKKIVRIGRKRGESHREIVAALETGLVESNLRNLDYGDADSQGWRQERASLYRNPTNVRASINRFYDETSAVEGKYGSAGDLAAAVQRPAAQYRGRYGERASDAGQILASLGGGGRPAAGQSGYDTLAITPGVDRSADRRAVMQQYLLDRGRPEALLNLANSLKGAQDTPGSASVYGGGGGRNLGGAADPFNGKVTLAPGADRPGVHTHKRILRFLREVSDRANEPLTIGTGTNHSEYTVSGNVSDHWVGRGADVPASGHELIRLGRKALIAAGMPKRLARKQTGGLFNLNGYQIIFNTQEGGDHSDHLHVGYRSGR